MSQKGRKPSAATLKLISNEPLSEASDGARPETAPRAATPSKAPAADINIPAVLTRTTAKDEYRRQVRELIGLSKWHAAFETGLAIYAQAYADWIEAQHALTYGKEGVPAGKIIVSPKGYPIQSPWLAIRNKAQETMLRVAGEYGLTLIAQVRVANAQLDLFDNPSARPDAAPPENKYANL